MDLFHKILISGLFRANRVHKIIKMEKFHNIQFLPFVKRWLKIMGEFLPISAAPRPQIFFSQDLLSDEEASELSSFIGEFHRDTRQRPPKTNKHKSFREWITRAREMSSNEMWSIFFTYLADDCVCFVDDRERIVNQREGSIRRKHTKVASR